MFINPLQSFADILKIAVTIETYKVIPMRLDPRNVPQNKLTLLEMVAF